MAKKKKSTLSKEYAGYIKAVRNLKARQRTQWKKHGIIIDVPVLTPKQLKAMGVSGSAKGQLTRELNKLKGEKLLSLASAKLNMETGAVDYLKPAQSKSIELPEGSWSAATGFVDSKSALPYDDYSPDDSLWYRTILANFKDMARHMVAGEAYDIIMGEIEILEGLYGKDSLGAAIAEAMDDGDFNARELFYSKAPAQEFITQVRDFLSTNYDLSDEKARQLDELSSEHDEYDE